MLSFISSDGDDSRENIKILKDVYASIDTTDINFLSVYIDSDSLPMKSNPLDSIPWKIVIEDNSWGSDIVNAYNINYLPFNILIDQKGEIVTRDIPVSDVKSLINTKIKKTKK